MREQRPYDYEQHGAPYSTTRRSDPRIEFLIHRALGNDAHTVLNVGAGTGSYEPTDRIVTAVEPSATMRAQRPAHLAQAVAASAEALPFTDDSFDASMAVLTIHHWSDPQTGLREMRRVTRGQVVIVTFDTSELHNFWLTHYAPEFIEVDKLRFPTIDEVVATLGGVVSVEPVAIPADCIDGIQEAFFARPEAFLDANVRASQSVWSCLADGVEERIVEALRRDLESGEWDKRYGHLRTQSSFESALRVIAARPL